MSDKVKVILDTDIGGDIDDALALAYLLSQPRCDLMGITTVMGQPELRAELSSVICRHIGRDEVPIHCGCDRPLLVESRSPTAPHAVALGDWPRRKGFSPANTAIEFMRRTIRENPGEIVLLAIGPFTNLAVLFATDPEIPLLLKELVLMGGSYLSGNQQEWNVLCDPHAAAIVYGEGTHPRPVRHISIGLDVTMKCAIPAEDCRKKFVAKSLEPVRDFAEVWFKHKPVAIFHDPLAAACIFEPQLCSYRRGKVRIPTQPPMIGYAQFSTEDPPLHMIAEEVDVDAFFDHYFGVLK